MKHRGAKRDCPKTELELNGIGRALPRAVMVWKKTSDVNGIIYARQVFGDNAGNGWLSRHGDNP
jgi:hypothetical protein